MLIYQLQLVLNSTFSETYIICEQCLPHDRVQEIVMAQLAEFKPTVLCIKTITPLMYCVGGQCGGVCLDDGLCKFVSAS